MKKLVFIPLIVISTSLFAQKFQIGIKGGVNVSNFVGSSFNNVDKKALIGFHGGGFLNLLFGDNFSIQPEAVFSSQGAKFTNAGTSQNVKVSYLSIPVLLKFRTDGGFYVEAGPQVSFKLSENVPNQSVNNFAKNLDLAFDAGLGYHGASGLGVGARYVVGLSKVGNFDKTDVQDPNFKNSVAQIFVFYTLFNNRKKTD
jgi:hypothetical protein